MSAQDLVVLPTSSTGLMPAMSVQQASQRYNMLVEFTKTVMVKDQDYGTIEGVKKPCLYKAGAEKLSTLFGLNPSFVIIERTEDWTGKDHSGEPFFYFFYKCQLMRGGEIVGEGDGSCNSWEKKYRYRGGSRKCPECGAEALIKGKPEYEKDPRFKGGFLCFAKKGGCGAKFVPGDPSIEGQDVAKVPNPDIAETVNTIQKMAQKRALVAAVLIACNASAFYTQDVEDMRTIDVEYEVEPLDRTKAKAAQQAIVDEALAKEHAGFPASDPAFTIQSIADRRAQQEKEAEAMLEPHTVKHAPHKKKAPSAVSFDMLKSFKEIKAGIISVTGNDRLYYEILKGHKVAKSTEIKTREAGIATYKDLGKALTAAREYAAQKAELAEIGQRVSVDGEKLSRFWSTMGAFGFEELDAVTPDALPKLLAELREI